MPLPIVLLATSDAGAIEAHLLRLDATDRSTRFTAGVVPDAAIARYVAGMPFGRDHVVGAFDGAGQLVALAHGCTYQAAGRARVEVAFSVDAAWRNFGLATALMATLRAAAEQGGVEEVVAMCLTRNTAMRRVFAHAGMAVEIDGGEVHASCAIDRRTRASVPAERFGLAC